MFVPVEKIIDNYEPGDLEFCLEKNPELVRERIISHAIFSHALLSGRIEMIKTLVEKNLSLVFLTLDRQERQRYSGNTAIAYPKRSTPITDYLQRAQQEAKRRLFLDFVAEVLPVEGVPEIVDSFMG